MATMNISLPDKMREWVESRTATGTYSNASDYVRDLIRRDQERSGYIAQMQVSVREGETSGVSDRSFDETVRTARQRAGEAA